MLNYVNLVSFFPNFQPFSFAIIISAINSTDEKKMMLKDIYNWIQTNVPEFGEGTVLISLTFTRLNEPNQVSKIVKLLVMRKHN